MRLFIAFSLPVEIKNYLAKTINNFKSHCSDDKAVKWVDANNIHLTVKFLGDTSENLLDPIKNNLINIGKLFSAINCSTNKVGAFPNLNKPRVYWIGIDLRNDDIFNLVKSIDKAMSQLGFEKESKKFKAHLTLGRVKNSNDLSNLNNYISDYKVEPKQLIFDKLCLYKSTLTPQGPIYECLHEVKLGEERFE